MALQHNYTITFMSLFAGTTYTLTIGGSSGTTIPLKGGAQPFTTDEDTNEDEFAPVRTQTGYVRILDDGLDANGSAWDWQDLLCSTDTERPVTLRSVSNGQTITHWSGFMQSQNLGSELWGNPQEREFPVQCPVSVLSSLFIDSNVGEIRSFAYVIKSLFTDVYSFTSYVFQGGYDARLWLMKLVEWQNFLQVVEGNIIPRYTRFEVLEDICRYWGWCAHVVGTRLVFTCMDEGYANNKNWMTFTPSEMESMSISSGIYSSLSPVLTLSGDVFVSTDNDVTLMRGVKRAVVTVDVNKEDTVIKFAPGDLEDTMGEPTTWVSQQGEDLVGFFTTRNYTSLDGQTLAASAATRAEGESGFQRRILYPSRDSEGESYDMILVRGSYSQSGPLITLETKQAIAFGGGSISFGGSVYNGVKPVDGSSYPNLTCRIGIGVDRAHAKWFKLTRGGVAGSPSEYSIISGWDNNYSNSFVLSMSTLAMLLPYPAVGTGIASFPKIPVAQNLYGKLFFEIWGHADVQTYDIGNLTIRFSREQTTLPTTTAEVRSRTIQRELKSRMEYEASNNNRVDGKWNVDCIFASDNDMEYGHGLIMNPDGSFMQTAQYNNSSATTAHPEQHLADRVAAYYSISKRQMRVELRSDFSIGSGKTIANITTEQRISLAGMTGYPLAIGRNWRDDVVQLYLTEL